MYDAVDDVKKNNKVRSVILCSVVPGIFCAGGLFMFSSLYRLDTALALMEFSLSVNEHVMALVF